MRGHGESSAQRQVRTSAGSQTKRGKGPKAATRPVPAHAQPLPREAQAEDHGEHVNIHPGGQAVVGIVETPGGGVRSKSEN
jgi:hypothetical protein